MTNKNIVSIKNHGFTIVELLVVIVVIGILAAITIISYSGISNKAIVASLQSDLDNDSRLLKMYNVEYGYYPNKIDDVTHCSIDPTIDTRYCLKASTDTTLTYSGGGQGFIVTATKSGISYRVTESLSPYAFTPTAVTGIAVTGTAAVGQTLIASNLAPAGANVTYQWQSATTSNGSYVNISGATSITYTVVSGDVNNFIKVTVTGTGDYTGAQTSAATVAVTVILTINAAANGAVNAEINGNYNSGSTPTITATPNSGYAFSGWSGDTGCSGSASHAITMDTNKTCTASFVADPWANWYAGIVATSLEGKHVYKTDIGQYQYKTTRTSVASPQGITGLDLNYYPSNMSLVSPQANPGVDFSAYPAQSACKAIGGRLPTMTELWAIYAGSATYGNNFQTVDYWSSMEFGNLAAYEVPFTYKGGYDWDDKIAVRNVRCIAD